MLHLVKKQFTVSKIIPVILVLSTISLTACGYSNKQLSYGNNYPTAPHSIGGVDTRYYTQAEHAYRTTATNSTNRTRTTLLKEGLQTGSALNYGRPNYGRPIANNQYIRQSQTGYTGQAPNIRQTQTSYIDNNTVYVAQTQGYNSNPDYGKQAYSNCHDCTTTQINDYNTNQTIIPNNNNVTYHSTCTKPQITGSIARSNDIQHYNQYIRQANAYLACINQSASNQSNQVVSNYQNEEANIINTVKALRNKLVN